MQPEPEHLTQILEAARAGDPQTAEELLPVAYEPLCGLADLNINRCKTA
jgi:hypothetical protein